MIQSQETQGFVVADFATLTIECVALKIILLFNTNKRTLLSEN